MQQMVSLLQILLLAQHVSCTIMPIIRKSRVLYRCLLPVVFGAVVFKLLVWCGAVGCSIPQTGHTTQSSTPDRQLENHSTKYHGQQTPLELLMMGIMVPETC